MLSLGPFTLAGFEALFLKSSGVPSQSVADYEDDAQWDCNLNVVGGASAVVLSFELPLPPPNAALPPPSPPGPPQMISAASPMPAFTIVGCSPLYAYACGTYYNVTAGTLPLEHMRGPVRQRHASQVSGFRTGRRIKRNGASFGGLADSGVDHGRRIRLSRVHRPIRLLRTKHRAVHSSRSPRAAVKQLGVLERHQL